MLPVQAALPSLLAALAEHGAVVLVAPPGAGKSTRVAPAILDADLVGDQRIVMLQPRRVAARMVARRIAAERGCAPGDEVGWAVRFERRIGPRTRIEIVTEGLLTRRLQADPFLEGVGCVILDEFHERSLHADLTLALLAEVRREVRPDLKLVVMSATFDPEPVAAFLRCPVVRAEGRAFPVEISYDPRPDDRPMPLRCALAVRKALAETGEGHVLAFLPGVGEIQRTAAALADLEVPVLPLHGSLPARAQDLALAPSASRKVVLATNIAETSVTLVGVRAVVDTGLARAPVFDTGVGITRLALGPISKASADQRAGRAGRTGPGWCRRLWTQADHGRRPEAEVPEIQRADLARTALEVRGWGADPRTLGWFEAPGAAALEMAEALLRQLGALDGDTLSPLGRTMLALPLPPRLARVVAAGHAAGRLDEAAAAAAIATERDLLRDVPEVVGDSDLELRLEALRRGGPGVDRRAVAEVRRVRDALIQAAAATLGPAPRRGGGDLVACLRAGFPDRVARRRAPHSDRFQLASGSGARLDPQSVVREAEWILAVTLSGAARGRAHRIRVACALDPSTLPVTHRLHTRFDPEREAVYQTRQAVFGHLVVRDRPAGAEADADAVAAALAQAVAADPRRALQPEPGALRYLARLRWLADARPDLNLPTFPELEPHDPPGPLIEALCLGHRSFAELRKAPLLALMKGLAGREVARQLDALAPRELTLPEGSTRRLEYIPGQPPVLAGRIQQFFGLAQTPEVAGQPVRLHLLAPNGRPAQITRDLASFWQNGYPDVRKDLRGRYPKHPWPEDPLTATPTRHTKRRR